MFLHNFFGGGGILDWRLKFDESFDEFDRYRAVGHVLFQHPPPKQTTSVVGKLYKMKEKKKGT